MRAQNKDFQGFAPESPPCALQHVVTSLLNGIKQQFQIGFSCAVIDDTSSQNQLAVKFSACEEYTAFSLYDFEQGLIQSAQITSAWRCIAETGDTERAGCDQLKIGTCPYP